MGTEQQEARRRFLALIVAGEGGLWDEAAGPVPVEPEARAGVTGSVAAAFPYYGLESRDDTGAVGVEGISRRRSPGEKPLVPVPSRSLCEKGSAGTLSNPVSRGTTGILFGKDCHTR